MLLRRTFSGLQAPQERYDLRSKPYRGSPCPIWAEVSPDLRHSTRRQFCFTQSSEPHLLFLMQPALREFSSSISDHHPLLAFPSEFFATTSFSKVEFHTFPKRT